MGQAYSRLCWLIADLVLFAEQIDFSSFAGIDKDTYGSKDHRTAYKT